MLALKTKVIVRLKRSWWGDAKGLHQRVDISYLRRKSAGFNFVAEDHAYEGGDVTWSRFVNIDECCDGVYEVLMCNVKRDYETGDIDDYDFKLVPYTDNKAEKPD